MPNDPLDRLEESTATAALVRLRAARPDDLTSVHALLSAESLPLDGVDEDLLQATIVAVSDQGVVGSASIEVHDRVGLLRSVVVATPFRGRSLGRRLVEERIQWSREQHLETIALFTETAHDFFARLDFEDVPRERLPREVHGSFEFGFCPQSSKSMCLELTKGTRDR